MRGTIGGQPVQVRTAADLQSRPIDDLIPYARNSRTHSEAQVAQIAASIREFGFTNPVLVDADNSIIAGHGRVLAARKLGLESVPVLVIDYMTEAQRRAYVIADNKLALNAGWDNELLALELGELRDAGFDLDLTGFDADELAALTLGDGDGSDQGDAANDNEPASGALAERFLIPPFSVFNAREGWWQNRKRAWLRLGIRSELGRGDHAAPGGADRPATDYSKSKARGDGAGRAMDAQTKAASKGGFGKCLETGIGEKYGREEMNGTSIFDPVLCEIAYRWFCPAGGLILDPFAGGSVRGIVAAKLGRQYVGHELRAEQVAANREQAVELCIDDDHPPAWIEGDSRNIDKTCADVDADFVFSCPPYADLEVYSDDPADLSTLAYEDFRDAYFEIIAKACARLKQDRFACFVIGEVRDKRGHYYDFVGDTVEAFRRAGLEYYNEAILLTAIGSLPVRAARAFSAARKLGKTHQNVLVFVKGDAKRATEACGEVETYVPEGIEQDGGAEDPAAQYGEVM